ncbi:hypothetical protein FB451DRAFT_1172197 [Mycena latifolia]|nr:hypothetical protein FB451DRAFT_1172197 [Mycena latifolia]
MAAWRALQAAGQARCIVSGPWLGGTGTGATPSRVGKGDARGGRNQHRNIVPRSIRSGAKARDEWVEVEEDIYCEEAKKPGYTLVMFVEADTEPTRRSEGNGENKAKNGFVSEVPMPGHQ